MFQEDLGVVQNEEDDNDDNEECNDANEINNDDADCNLNSQFVV